MLIYLVKKFGNWSENEECLLSDGFVVLNHWTIHDGGEVLTEGPLKGRLWSEIAAEIEDNLEWKPSTETMPLARLIMALRKETNDE